MVSFEEVFVGEEILEFVRWVYYFVLKVVETVSIEKWSYSSSFSVHGAGERGDVQTSSQSARGKKRWSRV